MTTSGDVPLDLDSEPGVSDIPLGTLLTSTTVIAASIDTGRRLLGRPDEFVNSQSQFDRQARVNVAEAILTVTPSIYLDFVSAQVMPWTADELAALKAITQSIERIVSRWPGITLPESLFLVKTSGREEGFAAYTRHKNVVALPANMVASLKTTPNFGDPLHPSESHVFLRDLIVHELFHIISKNNPSLREALYSVVHYQLTPEPVALPDVPWPHRTSPQSMPTMVITNPDAPALDVYIDMRVREDPFDPKSEVVTRHLLPVLMASEPYTHGLFFDYLVWYFIEVEPNAQGRWNAATGRDERPIVYLMHPEDEQLSDQYKELIGRNLSGERFHPEEIIANNFVFVANLPSLGLLERIEHEFTASGK